LTLGLAGSLVSIVFVGPWGTMVALCLFSLITGLSFPVQRQLVNDVIVADQFRATFLSVESILDRAVCAWVAASLGGFVAHGKIGLFLELSSGVSVLLIFVVMFKLARLRPGASVETVLQTSE
jgi:hypothetical protein